MKIKREDYKNIWFTSDWHLGHDRGFILNPRGFDNIKDHNEYLVETFKKMVDEKNDIVFHLGDFSFRSLVIYPRSFACVHYTSPSLD